ncbi:STM4504/CBY_0614 family protein [Flavobacteriaceae bacterium M23B6Z8]
MRQAAVGHNTKKQMRVYNLFSKRQKKLRGETSDILTYDKIPQTLKVQIVHIIRDCIGEDSNPTYGSSEATEIYQSIFDILCREYGRFRLVEDAYNDSCQRQILDFILQAKSTDEILDTIEVSFNHIETNILGKEYYYNQGAYTKTNPSDAIYELNERFKENAVGYHYTSGEIIRVDSTFIHSEVVKPTLSLLKNSKFKGANEEYLKAHEHFRHGRNKECINECLKSFESTLKIICKIKGWDYKETDTSRKLIQICFQNQLIPTFTQNQFTSLQNLVESGIPTIRNKVGGHGQGETPKSVDDTLTRYALNLTGSNIIFLIEQSRI